MQAEGSSTGPLAGCRALELGSTVAGPFCARLLGDFGAEVIKIEHPTGDVTRTMGSRQDGVSLYASSIMRNKHTVSLDLGSKHARRIIESIVRNCDFVIENFRPGTLERWGLGYDRLKEINPQIILIRISGFGQTGPYRDRPGYGVIGEAVSGLRDLTGDPDRPPPRVATSLTDYITGLYAAFGAVLALHARGRTGKGQVIDAALSESAFSFLEPYIPAFANLGIVAQRAGSRLPNNAPNNLYTARGGYVHIAAVSEKLFRKLAELMSRPDLPNDPRFNGPIGRARHQDELDGIIQSWTERHDVTTLETLLLDAGIPASRIYNIRDIFEDPQFKARNMLVKRPHEAVESVTVAGIVPKLSDTPGSIAWLGRDIGADTHDVLSRFAQLTDAEIQRLAEEGAVYLPDHPQSGQRATMAEDRANKGDRT